MLLNTVLVLGGIFSLVAIYTNEDNQLKNLLKSIIFYSLIYCIVRLNNSIGGMRSPAPVNVAVVIAMVAYVVLLFRSNGED